LQFCSSWHSFILSMKEMTFTYWTLVKYLA
jgi:hypothetical protein